MKSQEQHPPPKAPAPREAGGESDALGMEMMPIPAWLTDQNGACIYCNKAWRELTGHSPEEGPPADLSLYVHPVDHEALLSLSRSSADPGREFQMEIRVRRPGGDWRWMRVLATPRLGAGGRFEGYVGCCTDIHDYKMSHEEMLRDQQRLHQALDAGRMGTWEWNIKTGANKWSAELEAMHGLARGTFPGTFEAFKHDIHPSDRDHVITTIETTLENRGDYQIEYRIVRPDSSIRWVEARGQLVFDGEGAPERMFGVCIDITERKLAEEALRAGEARMSGIISSAMDAIISVGVDQRITVFNEAGERMFECPANEAIGRHINMFIPERYHEAHIRHIQGFGESGTTRRSMRSPGTLTARRLSGDEFPIEATISQVRTGEQRLFTVIIRDITERKRAQDALQESRRILESLMSHTLDVDETLRLIVDAAVMLTGARAAAVMTVDPQREALLLRTSRGIGRHEVERKISEARSIARAVLGGNHKGLVCLNPEDSARLPLLDIGRPIRSLIAVPIYLGRKPRGVIEAYSDELNGFTSQSVNTMEWFAGHASIALDHAQTFTREQRTVTAFQESLLADPQFQAEGYDFDTHYEAAFEEASMGGDFYDYIALDDGKVGIVVGDVSGKGLKAAVYTAMAKYMLRAQAAEDPSPADVLFRLNNAVLRYTDSNTFVSLCYALLDTVTHKMTVASAGHDPILRLRSDGSVDEIRARGLLLGIEPNVHFDAETLDIGKGDSLIVYTDGIGEARCDGELLGIEGLKNILEGLSTPDAPALLRHVYQSVIKFAGGRLRDDAVILAIRRVS